MAKKRQKRETGKRRVIFTLEALWATEVILMGDFNKWNVKNHPMKKDERGIWKKTVMLPPGSYEYRFLVDGEWENDPQNDQVCANSFGTQNNLLHVS